MQGAAYFHRSLIDASFFNVPSICKQHINMTTRSINHTFDRDLFAANNLPFAAYIESEGWNCLVRLTRPQTRHYETYVPQTVAIAEALFATIAQTGEWGSQYVTKSTGESYGASWRTENISHQYPTRQKYARWGKPLRLRDALRSLTRSEVYAFGRTDRHVADLEFGPYGNKEWHTTTVPVLCLDVDMDAAWLQRQLPPIRRELAIEAQLANALGLPYSAFRTGGRGHQAVLPLAANVDRSAAGWLLDAFINLLLPYHIQGCGAAKADAHNLQGIVRVAGGRHAKTERVAFWIDPTTGMLLTLSDQVRMMKTGYRNSEYGTAVGAAFSEAMSEIADFLLHHCRIAKHQYAPPVIRDLAFWLVVEGLPDNILVERFLNAQDEWGLPDEESLWGRGSMNSEHKDANVEEVGNSETKTVATNSALEKEQPVDAGTRKWAERVWAKDWPAHNNFWEWVREDGSRGITAAKVMFGADGTAALDAMLARVDAHPLSVSNPSKARERKRVLQSLFRTHRMLLCPSQSRGYGGEAFAYARSLAKATLSSQEGTLLSLLIARLRKIKRIQERCVADFERIIEVILLAFADERRTESRKGTIRLSLNDFVVIISERWHDTQEIDRSTVRRHLKRLTEGDQECGLSLIKEVTQSKEGALPVTIYQAGTDLRLLGGTSLFGSASDDSHCKFANKPSNTLRVVGGTVHLATAAKRGRRRVSLLECTASQ